MLAIPAVEMEGLPAQVTVLVVMSDDLLNSFLGPSALSVYGQLSSDDA